MNPDRSIMDYRGAEHNDSSNDYYRQVLPLILIARPWQGGYSNFLVLNLNQGDLSDDYWMQAALAEAQNALRLEEVPVGAVAVLDGRIIGRGHNRKESDSDPTAHAEIIALREAAAFLGNWRLVDVTLYSTLEPCVMCAGAMIQARLQRLVYGAKDLRFGADGSVVDLLSDMLFNHQITVTSGILEEESVALLKEFFRTLRERKNPANSF